MRIHFYLFPIKIIIISCAEQKLILCIPSRVTEFCLGSTTFVLKYQV